MNKRPILSISLLSSGRDTTIERCLQSLTPIREVITTELIIVDTDTKANEHIRDILDKYADRVVPFEWCDDFAKARNAGLAECSGEWFLFVDDDEWFLDSKPLIDFFKTGEYKRHASADIRIRNYLTEDKSEYNDGWVSRLTRLGKDTRFTGRVHEYLESPNGSLASIDATLGHTGYIFYSEADREAHAKRNIPLLKLSIAEQPENIHWYYQLYLEYDSLQNTEEQKQICHDAFSILEKRDDGNADAFYGFFVTGLLRLYRRENDWNGVIEGYKKYYDKKRFGVTPSAYIDMEMSLSLYETGDYQNAARYAQSYLKRYEKWRDRTEELRNEAIFFLSGTFSESMYGTVVSLLNAADIRCGDYSSFEKYFNTLKWDDNVPYDFTATAARYASIITENDYDEHFVEIVRAFGDSDIAKSVLKGCMEETDEKGRNNIISAIEALDNTTAIPHKEKEREGLGQMSDKPVLSISLLSSGRSETIERCLKSLQPFKEQLDTEIIIVDTDPDNKPDVRAIIEKYADRVIDFEWCDDFSAARNAGLFACKGEWYMYVDDDEWWLDAQPAIDFLKSKERDRYLWTNTKTRNYTSKDFSTYTDAWATRLVRRTKELQFKGKVHEYLDPLPGKSKTIEAIEGHTGYLYKDEEARKEHSKRNTVLLEKMIEEEPNEPRWLLQLLQEYDDTGDIDKQREICKRALRMLKDGEGDGFNRGRGLFAAHLIRVERTIKDWNAAIKAYEIASRETRYNDTAKAYMELDAAQAYFYTDNLKESALHCRNYLKIYKRWHKRLDEITDDLMYFVSETFEEHMWALAVNLLMYIEMKDGKFEAFDKYFDKANWTEDSSYDFRGYEDKFLEVVEQSEYDSHFAHMMEVFWSNYTARGVVQDHLQKLSADMSEKYWRLLRAMMEADLPKPTPWDIMIVWADHNDDTDADYQTYYEKLFSAANPLLLSVSMWEMADKHNVNISDIIAAQPFSDWRKGVEYFASSAPVNIKVQMANIFDKIAASDQKNYFQMKVLPAIIAELVPSIMESVKDVPDGDNGVIASIDAPEMEGYKNLENQLEVFKDVTLSYYRQVYSADAINADSELMEDDCRLALRLERILDFVKADDHTNALSEIKEAMGLFTVLDDALQAYSHLYAGVIKKRVSSPEAEMKQLIDSLYAKVDELVSKGFVNEARDVIAQIEQIAPPELRRK